MKKKLLIIGSTGFLGQFICNDKKFNKNYHIIKHGFSQKTDLNFDFTKKRKVQKYMKIVQPDIIINLICYSDVDGCEKNYKKALLLNEKVSKNIVETANKAYIIQISTDHVYNSPKASSERNIFLINNYAKTKYSGELVYSSYKKKLIIRTNFFGKSPKDNKGIVNWIINNYKKGKTIYAVRDIFFNPLHISTFCKILNILIKKEIFGTYNLGSKNYLSKEDFIKKFLKINKIKYKKIHSINYEQLKICKTPRPKYMIMNCKKLEKKIKIKMPNILSEISKTKYEI